VTKSKELDIEPHEDKDPPSTSRSPSPSSAPVAAESKKSESASKHQTYPYSRVFHRIRKIPQDLGEKTADMQLKDRRDDDKDNDI
jgi:hypothetical protein